MQHFGEHDINNDIFTSFSMGMTANFQMNSKFQGTKPGAEDGRHCVPRYRCAAPASLLACGGQGVKRAAGAVICRSIHYTAAEGFSSPPTVLNSRCFIHAQINLCYCLEGNN